MGAAPRYARRLCTARAGYQIPRQPDAGAALTMQRSPTDKLLSAIWRTAKHAIQQGQIKPCLHGRNWLKANNHSASICAMYNWPMNGAELKTALKEIGWSQGRLARELGVNPVTVSRWATGQLEVPRYAVAYLRVLRLAAQMLGES